MKKVYLCSDFLMTSQSEQYSNLRWFNDLLRRPIATATQTQVETFGYEAWDLTPFSRREFFTRSGIDLDESTRQFYFATTEINQSSIDYLGQFIDNRTLLIAYELSEQTRLILDKLSVTYIDVWLHPVRYLDDILFAVRSNNPEINLNIDNFTLDEYYFYLYADRIKVQSYKGYERNEIHLIPNSALFIGQTLHDKAICKEGEMLTLLDYKDEFERLTVENNKIYYSRHPHVKKGDEKILQYLDSLGNVELIGLPTYYLLANNSIEHIISISSSAATEAKYFDKKVSLLYKSPIETDWSRSNNPYRTIYQDVINPSFWSQLLSSCFSLESSAVPNISYLSNRDKIRDSLGFYWGYSHIDKLEFTRNKLKFIDKRLQRVDKRTPQKKAVKNVNSRQSVTSKNQSILNIDISNIKSKISEAEIVSFDVFDTLLERPFDDARGVFYAIKDSATAILNTESDFIQLRTDARSLAASQVSGEEVPLEERYKKVCEQTGCDSDEILHQLVELEKNSEEKYCFSRAIGKDLFQYAVSKGKDIILISDTYYDEDFVSELLQQNGYTEYNKLYVSSAYKKLKSTGNLYAEVLSNFPCDANSILHIGDNYNSDVVKAQEAGIQALHLPSTTEICLRTERVINSFRYADRFTNAFIRGFLSVKITENDSGDIAENTYSGGDASSLGYRLGGPMLLGFVTWLIREATANGTKILYFCARDGHIIKRCYDQISTYFPGAPASEYLYVSRRAVQVARITNDDDIKSVCSENFSPCRIADFVTNRLGLKLDEIVQNSILKAGFDDDNEVIRYGEDNPKLDCLISILSEQIKVNASNERKALLGHFAEVGLINNIQNAAIVDIGHNGTLQKGISNLLQDLELDGYYFATYHSIRGKLGSEQYLRVFSYAADKIDPAERSHPYNQYLLLFELLFLNDDPSLIKFEIDSSSNVKPVFMDSGDDGKRRDFARELHAGICGFISDSLVILGDDIHKIRIDGMESLLPLVSMFSKPTIRDAELMRGLHLENQFSLRPAQFVLANDVSKNDFYATSVWTEGAVVLGKNSYTNIGPLEKLVSCFYKLGLVNERKYRKFLRQPKDFFLDSKFFLFRIMSIFVRH